jgi:hypothetical protein
VSNPSNLGSDVCAFGKGAGRDNQGDGAILIGIEAGSTNSQDDILIVSDKNGNTRLEMDLSNGDLSIEGSLTENASLTP